MRIENTKLLDCSNRPLFFVAILELVKELRGCKAIFQALLNIMTFNFWPQSHRLGLQLLICLANLLNLEGFLLLPLSERLCLLPIIVSGLAGRITMDAQISCVSEHLIQVRVDLSCLQVLGPLVRYLTLPQGSSPS